MQENNDNTLKREHIPKKGIELLIYEDNDNTEEGTKR